MEETRFFHGNIQPSDVAQDLVAHFHRGNYQTRVVGQGVNLAVQISTSARARSGGQTSIAVMIHKAADGISVQVGKQQMLGVAASIGATALSAIRNPFALIGRIDDLAQDMESLKLTEEIWRIISLSINQHGAGHALSARLQRYNCPYCNTANDVGEGRCIACGAPLGDMQPRTCMRCGFVVKTAESTCPNCHNTLPAFK